MLAFRLLLAASIIVVTTASDFFPVLTVPAYNYGPGITSDVRSGSVIAADNYAATISLDCAKTRIECSLFPQQTLIIGPNTYAIRYGSGNDSESLQACDTMHAVCAEDYSAAGAKSTSSTTVRYSSDQVATLAIVLTAGAYLLPTKNPPVTASTPTPTSPGTSACTGTNSKSTCTAKSSTSAVSGAPRCVSDARSAVLFAGAVMLSIATGLLAVLL